MRTDWLLKERDTLEKGSEDYKVINQELDRREVLENRSDFVKIVARRNLNHSYK